MKKAKFTNMIGRIWHKCLSEENIKAGFRATGICPVNPSKFPQERFDARLLLRYNDWVARGKPEHELDTITSLPETPQQVLSTPVNETPTQHEINNEVPQRVDFQSSTPSGNSSFSSTSNLSATTKCQCTNCLELGPKPRVEPGKVAKPVWRVQNAEVQDSFEDLK